MKITTCCTHTDIDSRRIQLTMWKRISPQWSFLASLTVSSDTTDYGAHGFHRSEERRKNFSLSTESTIQGAQLQLFCALEEIQHQCRIDKEICGSRVELLRVRVRVSLGLAFVASLHWRLFVIFGHQNENLCRACMNWIYHLLYT